MVKATIGASSVLSRLQFSYSTLSGTSLAYLLLIFLDSLISERRLPLKGLGLMILMQLGFPVATIRRIKAYLKYP